MNLKLLSAGMTSFLLVGCIALPIPHERRLSPLYFGAVTDADTGKPIESVVVRVGGYIHSKQPRNTESKTDSLGNYEAGITENAFWYVLIAGPADGSCGGSVTFVHPEYEMKVERTDQARGGGVDGMCTGVKLRLDVSLKKKGI